MDASAPGQEAARFLAKKCNPFNKRDSPIAHMRDLYPHSICIPVVARYKEYSIPFPNYMDKGSYQRVADDEMYIHNHDFNETAKLVWPDFLCLSIGFVLFFPPNASFVTGCHRRSEHGSLA